MASVFRPMLSRCGASCCAVLHVRPSCSAKDDFIYAEEMQQYEKSGVLSQLHVAFSRDGASKVLLVVLHWRPVPVMCVLKCGGTPDGASQCRQDAV